MWIIMGYWTTGCSLNKNSLFPYCLFASGGLVGWSSYSSGSAHAYGWWRFFLVPNLAFDAWISGSWKWWCFGRFFLVDPYLCRTCSARVAWHIHIYSIVIYFLNKETFLHKQGKHKIGYVEEDTRMFCYETLSEHHNFRKQRPHIIMRILTTPQRYPSQKSLSFMGYYPPFSWKSWPLYV